MFHSFKKSQEVYLFCSDSTPSSFLPSLGNCELAQWNCTQETKSSSTSQSHGSNLRPKDQSHLVILSQTIRVQKTVPWQAMFKISSYLFCHWFTFALRKCSKLLGMQWKHLHQCGSCHVIQPCLLPHTLLYPFALAFSQTRLQRIPQCSFSSLCICFFPLCAIFFPSPSDINLHNASIKMLQYWHKTGIGVPSVCSNSVLFYTCHGIYDSVKKLPVWFFRL